MPDQKINTRVLARACARLITEEEMDRITGGQLTRSISHDPSGRPVDTTQD